MPGDGFAQRQYAETVGIAERIAVNRRFRRFDHTARSAGGRLSDLEMNHISANRFAFVGGPHHIHYDKWRNPAAIRDFYHCGDASRGKGRAENWPQANKGRLDHSFRRRSRALRPTR